MKTWDKLSCQGGIEGSLHTLGMFGCVRCPRFVFLLAVAFLILLHALAAWGQSGEAERARELAGQATHLFEQGNYTEAARLGEQALSLRESTLGAEHADTAESLDDLARTYRVLGDYSKALSLAQRGLAIREKVLGPGSPETARSLHSLSEIQRARGDFAQALPLAQRALAIREKTLSPAHQDTAESLNDLALLQHQLGDDNQALDLAARAFAIRERTLGPNHPLTAESVNNLGAVHWALKEYGLALPLFKRALEIKEKTIGPEHPDTGTAHNNLGELYRARGEWLKAVEHVNRAYTIWEKSLGPEHPRTAAAVSNLADLYWRMGDPVKSRAFYEKALAIKEKALGPEHPETAQAVNILAAFCQSAEDYDRSLALYKRGLALEDRLFENVFSVASEEQKLAFVEKSQGHYLAALSLIHRHFREDPQAVRFGLELVLRRKGIVLDSESRAREALVGQLEGKVLQVWQRMTALRSDLSRLLLSGPGDRPVAEHRTEIDKLQAAIAQEEEFLSRHSALAAGELSQRRVTVEAVAGRLPKDGVLVEFVLIRDWDEKRLAWARTGRYLAFVLTPDDRIRLVDLGDAAALHEKIAGTRAAISDFRLFRDLDAYTEKTEAGLSDLYGSLLQPLGEPVSSRQQLVLSPDGALNEVPFPALRTPDGQYLVEQRTVSHVSSGRDLLRGNTGVAPTLDLLLVANPKFDDEQVLQTSRRVERALRPQGFRQAFGALPGTAEEARIIPPLLAGTRRVLVEDGATESAVREARSPRVLHLATHGFFLADRNRPPPDPLGRAEQGGMKSASENPMIRSGLALAGANYAHTVDSGDDGILTAWEVSGMSLQGTDLVVLSACETGLGEIVVGEGVQGLRRAFVQAGARNLVMSLWPVDDQVTRDLMERFYRGYGHGEPVAMALRKAQIETIASLREELRKSSHGRPLAPVNLWAPFIVQQTGG